MNHGVRVVLVVLAMSGTAHATSPVVLALQQAQSIEQNIVTGEMAQVERVRARLNEAWNRAERGSADFLDAMADGETQESLILREEDLRQAESELLMGLLEIQRLRHSLLKSAARITETEAELRRLGRRQGAERDPLTGSWAMTWEPGGLEGRLDLILDGTLVQGNYVMDGGWSGSMRGSLVNRRIRLERIDSQLGFAAIYYADLVLDGPTPRLVGKWEATQLATGLPSAGGWVAVRIDESQEP